MRQALLAITFSLAAAAQTGVVDRVAVVVGNQVITESEVLLEVRLTAFLNAQPLDLSAAQRKAAAERLVDQQLIRNEMQVGGYTVPADSEGDAALRSFRQENYQSVPAFRAAVAVASGEPSSITRTFSSCASVRRTTSAICFSSR